MRILGIDPGSAITGYGLLDFHRGGLRLVAAGALKTPRQGDLPARLRAAADRLRDLLAEHRPDAVGVERVFSHVNVHSALVLAHMRGALLLELARGGVPIHEYTALQIKKALTGHGHAGKDQVRSMVIRLLGNPVLGGPNDVSDALAVAICHAHSMPASGRLSLR